LKARSVDNPTDDREELRQYLSQPLYEGKGGPLLWWNLNASQFPVLSKMAADFLAVQASSVAVEELFSSGADLVTAKRCSLGSKKIEQCMLLKYWIKESEDAKMRLK
jgi:hypothetical protein